MTEERKNQVVMYETPEEERKAKEKAYNQKLIKKIVCRLILIAIVIIAALIYCYPFRKVDDDTIKRDLKNSGGYIPTVSLEDRLAAWDSELPQFMTRDINLAKEKNYKIQYSYGTSTINIYYEDNVLCLVLDSPYSWYMSASFGEPLYNFSIYRSEDSESLEIYGYTLPKGGSFEKVVLYSDVKKIPYSDTLSYNTNMPLSMDVSDTIQAVTYGDYSLYVDPKSSTFSFYKNGNVVSTKVFQDSIEEIYRYSGFIKTKNGLLYKMYVYERNGNPEFYFVFIADGMSFIPVRYSSYASIKSDDISLPIVTQKGDNDTLYVLVPKNWEVYSSYGTVDGTISKYTANQDYSMEILKLEDKFVYAEFIYDSYWKLVVSFNINNRIFSATYKFDGYDSNVSLSDDEKSELSVKVLSEEAIFEHIEKIRAAYKPYYDNTINDLIGNSSIW